MKSNFVLFFLLVVTNWINGHPRLLIKIPTRSRPQQFFAMLDKYYQKLSGEVPYLFLISCDSDDNSMNNPAIIERFKTYKNLSYKFGHNTSKIMAYNDGVPEIIDDFDIILVTSDDMEPIVQGYDKIIAETMEQHFSDFDGTLNFSDGRVGGECNTYPILGSTYFKRFGYIYHPDYASLFCDEEFTIVANMLQKTVVVNNPIIVHRHPALGSGKVDELYQRNDSFCLQDRSVFVKRLIQDFELSQIGFTLQREMILSPKNITIENPKPLILGKTKQPAFLNIYINNNFIGSTQTDRANEWKYHIPLNLTPGPYTIQVIARYKEGNHMLSWGNEPNVAFDESQFWYQISPSQ